jgi:hypothetical protein
MRSARPMKCRVSAIGHAHCDVVIACDIQVLFSHTTSASFTAVVS